MVEAIINKYEVPTGLRPLLEAFAREALLLQPKDLQYFGKIFFDTLYDHKMKNPNIDIIENCTSYNYFISDLQNKYKLLRSNNVNLNISQPSSSYDNAAIKIQAAFRGHQIRNNYKRYGIENVNAIKLNLKEDTKNI